MPFNTMDQFGLGVVRVMHGHTIQANQGVPNLFTTM